MCDICERADVDCNCDEPESKPPSDWIAEFKKAFEKAFAETHGENLSQTQKQLQFGAALWGYAKGLEDGRAEMKAEWQREHTAKVDAKVERDEYKRLWEKLHADMERRGPFKMAAQLTKEIERLTTELEQTRVQLAGCGVAAMQNTESSKANRAKPGDYGWSASYGDVCAAVDREIALSAELAEARRERDALRAQCEKLAGELEGIGYRHKKPCGCRVCTALDEYKRMLDKP